MNDTGSVLLEQESHIKKEGISPLSQ
ncbi:hypothetical protein IFVP177_C140177 [Vibrio parahaemolyticus]